MSFHIFAFVNDKDVIIVHITCWIKLSGKEIISCNLDSIVIVFFDVFPWTELFSFLRLKSRHELGHHGHLSGMVF